MLKRKKKKIPLKELSKVLGISIGSISQYETGRIGLRQENRIAYEQYIDNKNTDIDKEN
jgi:transcriptional regulator with XRE-family HTH domain